MSLTERFSKHPASSKIFANFFDQQVFIWQLTQASGKEAKSLWSNL
jgi:hypothetical protein